MPDIFQIILLFIAGCAAGLIGGLLGVGGGVIYVAVLSIFFNQLGINEIDFVRFTLSNSFFAIFFSSMAASIQQIRLKNFFPREVFLLALTSIAGSLLISFLILRFDWYSKNIFNIFFISVLTFMMVRMFLSSKKAGENNFIDKIPLRNYSIVGVFTGIFSALSGLGGGVITVPYLADLKHLKIKKATSISLGAMPFMAIASAVFYMQFKSADGLSGAFGFVYPSITIPMVAGVLLTSAYGVNLSKKLSERTIRLAFAGIMLLVIISTLAGML